MKVATKLIRHYPPYLRHVAKLPWEIKDSIMQIFSIYGKICKLPVLSNAYLLHIMEVSLRKAPWAQISDGRDRRPPITAGVRKLEWLPFCTVSKYPQCIALWSQFTNVTDWQTSCSRQKCDKRPHRRLGGWKRMKMARADALSNTVVKWMCLQQTSMHCACRFVVKMFGVRRERTSLNAP